jgi:coenzyme F420-reducing hydrogenase gamma subunit
LGFDSIVVRIDHVGFKYFLAHKNLLGCIGEMVHILDMGFKLISVRNLDMEYTNYSGSHI